MSEEELVKKAIAGDNHCLHILLEMHYKMLYGFLIKMCGNTEQASDLVQETLLKACLKIETFRGECKFSTYLIQIALNLYKNEQRKHRKSSTISLEDFHVNLVASDHIETQVAFEEALKTLQEMSYEKRMSFILRHYYGYTIEEISTYFNVSEGTTKSRIHNAINYLKKRLS